MCGGAGDRKGHPYGNACRGGRPCPPDVGVQYFCRAGPVCPAVGMGKNPPVTASPCQPPLGKGAKGTGDADCHSQCAHWLRNDTLQKMRCKPGSGRRGRRPLRMRNKGCRMRAEVGIGPYGGFSIEFRRGRCEHRPTVTQLILFPASLFCKYSGRSSSLEKG